jgi:hypothetical protein
MVPPGIVVVVMVRGAAEETVMLNALVAVCAGLLVSAA